MEQTCIHIQSSQKESPFNTRIEQTIAKIEAYIDQVLSPLCCSAGEADFRRQQETYHSPIVDTSLTFQSKELISRRPPARASRLESSEMFRWGIMDQVPIMAFTSSAITLSRSRHRAMNFPSAGSIGSRRDVDGDVMKNITYITKVAAFAT